MRSLRMAICTSGEPVSRAVKLVFSDQIGLFVLGERQIRSSAILLFFLSYTISSIVAQRQRAVKSYVLGVFRALPPNDQRANAPFIGPTHR